MGHINRSAHCAEKDFHVALSFAGEDRAYVSSVANVLGRMGFRIFYDKHETATMWGKDLYIYLREIYSERALYTVMFISEHYAQKLWTNHERQSAQARAFREHQEYILPARFDDTTLPGLLETIYYIDLRATKPKQLAELIKKKLGHISRPNLLPEEPDKLYSALGIENPAARKRVRAGTWHLWHALGLMTRPERDLLRVASSYACPTGVLEKNIHLNLEYLARLSRLEIDDVLRVLSRLDCLGIKSRMYEEKKYSHDRGALVSSTRVVELKFEIHATDFAGNGTDILEAIFRVLDRSLCEECSQRALNELDFSFLGTLSSPPEHQREPST